MSQQNKFINKKNIGYVNFLVSNELGLSDLSKDDKRYIIKVLVNNMNYVYGKLNHSKINKRNIKEATDKFNQLVYKRTVTELQKDLIEDTDDNQQYQQQQQQQQQQSQYYDQNIEQMKMDRDRMNNPNRQIQYLEHPTDMNDNYSNQFQDMDQVRMSRDMVTAPNAPIKYLEHPEMSFNTRSNDNFEQSFQNQNTYDQDRLLKTRDGPQYVDRQMAVSSTHGLDQQTANMSANDRFNQLQQMRENELTNRVQRPPTPEFIRNNREQQKTTSVTSHNQNNMNQNNRTQENNFGLDGVGNDDNLGSLDNYGESLAPKNVSIDESISVEDRLKQMEQERGNLNMPQQTNDKAYNRNMSMSNKLTISNSQENNSKIRQQKQAWKEQQLQYQEQQKQNQSKMPQRQEPPQYQSQFSQQLPQQLSQQLPQQPSQQQFNENVQVNQGLDEDDVNNIMDMKIQSIMDPLKSDILNSINPYLQNTNNLRKEFSDYKSKQSNMFTTQINDISQKSMKLESLISEFKLLQNDISTKLELLNKNTKSYKKFLLDEENFVKSNSEFVMDLKPDLQSGNLLIKDLELRDELSIIDLHNNRFYFKLNNADQFEEDKETEVELNSLLIEPGSYTNETLIENLNKKLEKYQLVFENNNNIISVKLKKNDDYNSFNIYNLENSLLLNLGFTHKKYENAVKYNSENKLNLKLPNIYNFYLIDKSNDLIKLGKYNKNNGSIFMDEYKYNNLEKLRFKIKLDSGYCLNINNIKNLELSIEYVENTLEYNSNNSESYSFSN